MTYEIINSLLKVKFKEIKNLGLKTINKRPSQDTLDVLSLEVKKLKNVKKLNGFGLYMVLGKDNIVIIGNTRFKTLPNPQGEVEIGHDLLAFYY